MQKLLGAIAYRHDLIPKYRREIPEWGFCRQLPEPVACRRCAVKYDVMVEAAASQSAEEWYVGKIRVQLDEDDCSKHTEVCRILDRRGQHR